jgi:hypothetical protein
VKHSVPGRCDLNRGEYVEDYLRAKYCSHLKQTACDFTICTFESTTQKCKEHQELTRCLGYDGRTNVHFTNNLRWFQYIILVVLIAIMLVLVKYIEHTKWRFTLTFGQLQITEKKLDLRHIGNNHGKMQSKRVYICKVKIYDHEYFTSQEKEVDFLTFCEMIDTSTMNPIINFKQMEDKLAIKFRTVNHVNIDKFNPGTLLVNTFTVAKLFLVRLKQVNSYYLNVTWE